MNKAEQLAVVLAYTARHNLPCWIRNSAGMSAVLVAIGQSTVTVRIANGDLREHALTDVELH